LNLILEMSYEHAAQVAFEKYLNADEWRYVRDASQLQGVRYEDVRFVWGPAFNGNPKAREIQAAIENMKARSGTRTA
jgi:hypothetical protein